MLNSFHTPSSSSLTARIGTADIEILQPEILQLQHLFDGESYTLGIEFTRNP